MAKMFTSPAKKHLVRKNSYLVGKDEEFLLLSKSNHGLNILSCEHLQKNTILKTNTMWDLMGELNKVNGASYLASWISRVDNHDGPDFAPETLV